jgi:hypothetical protein
MISFNETFSQAVDIVDDDSFICVKNLDVTTLQVLNLSDSLDVSEINVIVNAVLNSFPDLLILRPSIFI